jgi:hypothetical protein
MNTETLLPCPFCGTELNIKNEEDIIYPDGIGWKDHDNGMRSYHKFIEVPHQQWCWGIYCSVIFGGCGAEMHGDSREEVVLKWNTRTNK